MSLIACKQTRLYICVQIVAYNKMDVPDSSDYWPDIQQSLEAAGVAPHLMCPISAVTGQGVLDLIRMVHTALDELPSEVGTLSGCLARCTSVGEHVFVCLWHLLCLHVKSVSGKVAAVAPFKPYSL